MVLIFVTNLFLDVLLYDVLLQHGNLSKRQYRALNCYYVWLLFALAVLFCFCFVLIRIQLLNLLILFCTC